VPYPDVGVAVGSGAVPGSSAGSRHQTQGEGALHIQHVSRGAGT
jgi:hypothetical protein